MILKVCGYVASDQRMISIDLGVTRSKVKFTVEGGGGVTCSTNIVSCLVLDFISNKAKQDHNVPCAVCQAERNNVLMIPAKYTCYPGWHKEYSGYLVAERRDHKSNKMFECLDHDPEADQAGYRNENGALMYPTKGYCGSLPCPPYEEGKPLTCVVCTK